MWGFDAPGALVGTPALSDGVVYLGSLNNAFFALDAETGDERWRFETEGWVWGGPLVDDCHFFGDLSARFTRWMRSMAASFGPSMPRVACGHTLAHGGDLLYLDTREGKVYALSAADGTQEWVQSLSGAIYSNLVIAGGLVGFPF